MLVDRLRRSMAGVALYRSVEFLQNRSSLLPFLHRANSILITSHNPPSDHVIVPGASQNPTHYALFAHHLQLSGYPTFSALLPSVGTTSNVTVEDDAQYIRDKMLLPILDHEERDVVIFFHSYSSVPGSAAVAGLSKRERSAAGKKTGVVAQIHLATLLVKGGDGGDTVGASFGGTYPPHIRPEVSLFSLPPTHLELIFFTCLNHTVELMV